MTLGYPEGIFLLLIYGCKHTAYFVYCPIYQKDQLVRVIGKLTWAVW